MTYKGYKADIKFDSDANTFYGEILNSSAVIHFRGNSVEELEKSFREGVDEYLIICEKEGISPHNSSSRCRDLLKKAYRELEYHAIGQEICDDIEEYFGGFYVKEKD